MARNSFCTLQGLKISVLQRQEKEFVELDLRWDCDPGRCLNSRLMRLEQRAPFTCIKILIHRNWDNKFVLGARVVICYAAVEGGYKNWKWVCISARIMWVEASVHTDSEKVESICLGFSMRTHNNNVHRQGESSGEGNLYFPSPSLLIWSKWVEHGRWIETRKVVVHIYVSKQFFLMLCFSGSLGDVACIGVLCLLFYLNMPISTSQ